MVEFSYLVAKDNFKLGKGQRIDLKKLSVLLKNNGHFKISGDPSISIDTFSVLQIKNEFCFFNLSYKGSINYLKITSFDFFLHANEFKKNFFEDYVKKCLVNEQRTKKNYKAKDNFIIDKA